MNFPYFLRLVLNYLRKFYFLGFIFGNNFRGFEFVFKKDLLIMLSSLHLTLMPATVNVHHLATLQHASRLVRKILKMHYTTELSVDQIIACRNFYVVIFYMYLRIYMCVSERCLFWCAAARDGSEDSFSGIERGYGHWNRCSPFQVYNSVSFCCFHCTVLCVFKFENVIMFLGEIQNVSQTEKINTSWLSGCVLWGVPGIAKTDISNHGSSSIFDEIQHDPIDQEKPESRRRNTAPNQQ